MRASRASSRAGPRPSRRGASCPWACLPRRHRGRRSRRSSPRTDLRSRRGSHALATRGRTGRCRRARCPTCRRCARPLRTATSSRSARSRSSGSGDRARSRGGCLTRSARGSSPRRHMRRRRRRRPSRPARSRSWSPAATTRTGCRPWSWAPTAADPADSHAVRPMLKPCSPTLLTQPVTTWPIAAGSMPERSTSADCAAARRSAGWTLDRPPPRRPTGVRTASTITTSVMCRAYRWPCQRALRAIGGDPSRRSRRG